MWTFGASRIVAIDRVPGRLEMAQKIAEVEVIHMRKILMTTFGSYGDLNPYLAMARVLCGSGDQVTIATHAEYQERVERIGVRFVPLKPGLDELGPQETWAAKA